MSYLFEIELWTFEHCQPFQQSWFAAILSLLRYAPAIITFLLYFVGLRYKELYLFLFGIGLTLSALINEALNSLIVRAPRIPTCPPLRGAAIANEVQQVAFFTVFSLGYIALYRPRTKLWHLGVLLLFYALSVIGSHLLNYHFSDAIVAGAVLGTILAFAYQSALHFWFVPQFCKIVRIPFVLYMGYQDTLCSGESTPLHVIVLENLDKRFGTAQYIERRAAREFIAEQVY